MKKIILVFCTLLIFWSSFAQLNFSIKGGITQSYKSENIGTAGINENVISKIGIQIGATTIIPISKSFSFRPALQFTQKGYHTIEKSDPPGTYYWNRNVSLSYLELPLEVLYCINKNKATKIFIGTGPVASLGLFGKGKYTLELTSNGQFYSEKNTDNHVFKDNGSNRMDIGWDFLIAVQVHRISLNAAYNCGLLSTVDDDWHYLKNRSFAFTVGYLLKY
ncbi:MAG: porin family protein [Ferruginibacter sp.]